MPKPPASAAINLKLPELLADGSYATPNRNLSDAATIWHVRSALNVAVLGCPQGTALAADYNQLLRIHRDPLKRAHSSLSAESRDLDTAMTRVYNYFSQPPAQRDFCPVATALLSQSLTVQPADFASFARAALPQLDAPFIAFYRAYDAYRADLAFWRAGAQRPQIAYDGRDFLRDAHMTGGERPKILATR
ncbi:MAG: hypothetical protein EOP61_29930 [Sphingomonadales bacterium]|nr:MAG: hypothetical protein EOP61_29930 [Sphingomonadales bacterium]